MPYRALAQGPVLHKGIHKGDIFIHLSLSLCIYIYIYGPHECHGPHGSMGPWAPCWQHGPGPRAASWQRGPGPRARPVGKVSFFCEINTKETKMNLRDRFHENRADILCRGMQSVCQMEPYVTGNARLRFHNKYMNT